MRFALESDHREFASIVDSLLGRADTSAIIRAWTDGDTTPGLDLWGRLAETGVTALLIPESHDGMGAGAVDMMVAAVELGRHAVPGPIVESIAVLPSLLAAVGDDAGLATLAEGAPATVAIAPDQTRAADTGVCGDAVYIVSGGRLHRAVVGDVHASVDRARTVSDVTPGADLGAADAGRAALLGALATAAQLQGLGERMLGMGVEYAKQRKQFGREIGQFQAVKHHLANVAVGLEMSRPLLWAAAMAVDESADLLAAAAASDTERVPGLSALTRDVSAARVACADAAYRAARTVFQVHGGIGYTMEHDLSLWLTKTRALQSAWGTASVHRSRIVDSLEKEGARR